MRELCHYLDRTGKSDAKKYVPHRKPGDKLQVIAVVNFKGGSGKTTTTAHLAQHLALTGHRVLAVDLDPQASLSALHGFQPELDRNPSLYDAIRYDSERKSITEVIRETNFPDLDIVPANLELQEYEYDTPLAMQTSVDGKRFFTRHSARLVIEERLETEPRPGQAIFKVSSADSTECLRALAEIRPGVVLLAGCRLLSRQTLADMPCPVLNYHAGITPKYRGMNGGYWALASGDAGNFGTTVHLVDAGVDTGGVLGQARGRPQRGDTIATYALRMAAFSRGMCAAAVENALAGRLAPLDPGLPSRQWYHPTLWRYLWTGMTKGVW